MFDACQLINTIIAQVDGQQIWSVVSDDLHDYFENRQTHNVDESARLFELSSVSKVGQIKNSFVRIVQACHGRFDQFNGFIIQNWRRYWSSSDQNGQTRSIFGDHPTIDGSQILGIFSVVDIEN